MNRHHHDDAPWPEGRQAPRLLESLYRFLAKRAEGSLGHFDLEAEAVSAEAGWGPHFAGTTWSFMRLPDGSRMALCEAVQPPAVVYLGSEGDLRTVAESLEQFLIDWAGNEVDVGELALDEDADADELVLMKKARKAFRAWLKKEGVVAPAVEGSFDFSAYAEGDPACRRAPGQGVDSTPRPSPPLSWPPWTRPGRHSAHCCACWGDRPKTRRCAPLCRPSSARRPRNRSGVPDTTTGTRSAIDPACT